MVCGSSRSLTEAFSSSCASTLSSTSESELVLMCRRSCRNISSFSLSELVRLPLWPSTMPNGRVDVERLRLGRVGRRAGGRVAAMGDADVARQRAHVARAEHVAHHAGALVHVEGVVLAGDDARRVLAAVLQEQQPVVEQLVDGRASDDSEDPAHGRLTSRVWLRTNHSASDSASAGGSQGLSWIAGLRERAAARRIAPDRAGAARW